MEKNKKKYLIIIVSVIVLILCISNIVKLTKNKSCFSFDSATGTITDYLCDITDVVIPNEINGIKVTTIGKSAFSSNNLTSVVIPDSVTSIESYAFSDNNLTNVVIPEGVEGIYDRAFSSNNLTSVVIPDSVTDIGNEAFANNELISVTIGSGVEYIYMDYGGGYSMYGPFYNNPTLTSIKVDENNKVYDSRDNSNAIIETSSNTLITGCKETTIPNAIKEIGENAFRNMGLTEIEIPSSVEHIYFSAFEENPTITSIKIDEGNTVYDSRDNSNAIIETSTNTLIMGCKNTVIPSTVTEIGDYALYMMGLTEITIPSSVTSIGTWAFYGNENLSSIKVDENNKVYDSRNNSNAIIETSTNTLIMGCKNTIIPSTVTSIGEYAFYEMDLTSIKIPNSVETIGKSAFKNNNLTSVKIPNSVKTIDEYAFYGNNLTEITIPSSVETIGDSAFSSNYLTSVVIPDSVKTIGYSAFYSNSSSNPNLTTIYNLTGRAFDWNNIIKSRNEASFITGTVTTTDDRVVTITTK